MTASEKKDLYTLFRLTDNWLCGYNAPDFFNNQNAETVFFDDKEIKLEKPHILQQAEQIPDANCNVQTSSKFENNLDSEIPKQVKNDETDFNHKTNLHTTTLESIAKKIETCHNCVLCQQRIQTVPGEGVTNPYVLVIGEGPGEEEDKTGRPFVGKAGQLLDKMLSAINLDRTCNCYIANIVKCRPPQNRAPQIEEALACSGYLQAQIHILKPKMILALGRSAVQSLLQTSQGINALRGKFFTYQNIPLLATYHPSALLRNEELKKPAWQDLKTFREKLMQEAPTYSNSFISKHTKGYN